MMRLVGWVRFGFRGQGSVCLTSNPTLPLVTATLGSYLSNYLVDDQGLCVQEFVGGERVSKTS